MDRFEDEKKEIDELEAQLAGLNDEEAAQPGEDPEKQQAASEPAETEQEPGDQDQPAEAEQQGEPTEKEQRTVPYQALHAERSKRQAMEAELEERRRSLDEMRGEMTALKETFTSIATQREDAKKAQEAEAAAPKKLDFIEVPTWDDDPRAHLEAVNKNAEIREHNMRIELEQRVSDEAAKRVEEHMAPIQKAYGEHQTSLEEQTQKQQLYGAVAEQEGTFALEQPDYYDAVEALKAARVKDYQALNLSPVAAQQAVVREMETQARQFMEARMDPARSWYALAQNRGWNPNAAQSTPAASAEQEAPKPKTKGKPSAETLQRGMESSGGLAQASSSGGEGNVNDPEATIAKYLEMPDEEFAEHEGKIAKLLQQMEQG